VLLARGETDWVFVDTASGRPLRIPDGIASLLPLLEDE
jgi:acyl-CoA thioesterase FadM